MSNPYKFPFEEDALAGNLSPDGLDLVDMRAYFILKMIYREYNEGRMTRKEAAQQRSKLIKAYLADRQKEDSRDHV